MASVASPDPPALKFLSLPGSTEASLGGRASLQWRDSSSPLFNSQVKLGFSSEAQSQFAPEGPCASPEGQEFLPTGRVRCEFGGGGSEESSGS
ncbi:unnamed protein product, partial [Choristocarpus tenellus]